MQVNELSADAFEDLNALLVMPESKDHESKSSLTDLEKKSHLLEYQEVKARLKLVDKQIGIIYHLVDRGKRLISHPDTARLKHTDFYRDFVYRVCKLKEMRVQQLRDYKHLSKQVKELEFKIKKCTYSQHMDQLLQEFSAEFVKKIQSIQLSKDLLEFIARYPYQLREKLKEEHLLKDGAVITAQEYTAILTHLFTNLDISSLSKINDCMSSCKHSQVSQTRYYATQIEQVMTYLSLNSPPEALPQDRQMDMSCPLLHNYTQFS